ncbi:MAG TPA: CHASE3 domain-containing protein [Gemmataceae bacterium]|nr:CHASE3 domain-containing protein [Gemmataceae bacterium]
MGKNLSIFQKGLLLVSIPLLFQLAFIGLLARVQGQNAEAERWANHSQEVLTQAHTVLGSMLDAETGVRGWVVTGDPVFAEPYERAVREVPASVTRLRELVQDNPAQKAGAGRISASADKTLAWHAAITRLLRVGQRDEATAREKTGEGKRLMDELRQEMAAFVAEEERLNAARGQALEQSRQRLNWLVFAGGLATFLSTGALTFGISRGLSTRLATLADNTQRLAQGKELVPPLAGTDEVARVDRAFHDMARELARSRDALRESREHFRMLVESAIDYALIALDPEGHVVSWNTGAERIKGYRAEEVIGKHFSCFYPAEAVERGWPDQELRGAASQGRFEDEGWRVRKDGSRFWANVVITALRNGKGEVVGFSKLTRDLTERKRAEDAVRQFNEDLERRVAERTADLAEANRDLAQKNQENEMFVYSVSHDLRSPLVNLQGFSKELSLVAADLRAILADGHLPAGVQKRGLELVDRDMAESIRFIQTAVSRLSNIIDALLRLSRAGRVEYQEQPVDVAALVCRIVASMQGTAGERGATARAHDLPPAWGDPTALEQVFANLIGNALNYLDPRRPGLIEVGSAGTGSGDGLQTYYVKDNGLGIPEPYQHKVFQAFQRVHPEVARGEGMGLAIVRRVVERHRGRVWLESRPGEGSTFFVALPALPGDGPPGRDSQVQAAAAAERR